MDNEKMSCKVYPKGIPEKIINSEVECNKFKQKKEGVS